MSVANLGIDENRKIRSIQWRVFVAGDCIGELIEIPATGASSDIPHTQHQR